MSMTVSYVLKRTYNVKVPMSSIKRPVVEYLRVFTRENSALGYRWVDNIDNATAFPTVRVMERMRQSAGARRKRLSTEVIEEVVNYDDAYDDRHIKPK